MNCGSDLCVAILFWSILSRPLVILFSSTDKCDYSASLAPSQESGQDWQIPFPHFSDVNFQSDFNTRCSEYVCVCLHVRSSRADMMMIDQIISKAGELCWDISTATENPIHWTLLNTTPERPRTHEGNFLRQWMTILVKADNRQSNHPWHSLRAVSCCTNTHSAALWWVMRQSTNYWTRINHLGSDSRLENAQNPTKGLPFKQTYHTLEMYYACEPIVCLSVILTHWCNELGGCNFGRVFSWTDCGWR